jgi:hypothetical protein
MIRYDELKTKELMSRFNFFSRHSLEGLRTVLVRMAGSQGTLHFGHEPRTTT